MDENRVAWQHFSKIIINFHDKEKFAKICEAKISQYYERLLILSLKYKFLLAPTLVKFLYVFAAQQE